MATHHCPPDIAISIAARLVRANVSFNLEVRNRTQACVECMNQETLDIAVKQAKAERFNDFTGIERRAAHRPEITGSSEYPNSQNFPRQISETEQQQKFFIDLPSGTEQVHCTAHVDDPASRIPATVGDTPACGMTDTEFDSDPSVVLE